MDSTPSIRRTGAETELLTSLTPLRRRLAFYLLLLGAFMPSFNLFVVTIALPVIRSALAATPAESSLIVSGYSSAYAVCLITGGRLGDLFGRRRMFLIGMTGFTAMSLLCGVAPNIGVLVAGRVLQGVFSAVMAPPVLASIRTLFSQEEIPWALNIYGTGIGIAVASGQFLGGMLIAVDAWGLGWRTAFLINVPVGIVALAFVPFVVPESEGQEKPRLDYGGVLLLSAALTSFVLPLSMGREQHWAPLVLVLLAAAPVLVVAFLGYERALLRRGGMPVLDARLLEIRSFRQGLVVALLFFFTAPFYLFFSLYLQAGLGQSPLAAGLAVLPYGIANFVGPMLATRFPASARPYLFGIGMALELLGYGAIAVCAAVQIEGWRLFAAVFISGFGQGIAMPEMINTILAKIPRASTGLAAGMMNSTLQLGASISVAAIGSVFFTALGDGRSAFDYGHALGIAMAWQVVALGLSMLLGLRNARG
jgi:EmrB/QacA subfamily drug resistance transporter